MNGKRCRKQDATHNSMRTLSGLLESQKQSILKEFYLRKLLCEIFVDGSQFIGLLSVLFMNRHGVRETCWAS